MLDSKTTDGNAHAEMMESQTTDYTSQPPAREWSNRILIVALLGILFLTLFPFRFAFSTKLPGNASPFLLGGAGKIPSPLDAFLNILLFVPFGFGLGEKLRERGKSRPATLLLTLAAGFLLSYGIEFLQIYIPSRDSGWEDVLTNGTGAGAGFLLFEFCGRVTLRLLSGGEAALAMLLNPGRAVLVLPVYFVLWFAVSIPLQRETRLSNWDPGSLLVVGNDASGRLPHAWKGTVLRLQFWNRALPPELAQELAAGATPEAAQSGLLASYDFSVSPPVRDQAKFLPELSRKSHVPANADPKKSFLDGGTWLSSDVPVSVLVADVQRTNQFAVRVVCVPAEASGANGRIVSISRPSGVADLTIRQENADLVFWFRNPLTVKRVPLAWNIPNVFSANQARDILFSYDGSSLSLFVDGKKGFRTYQMGPGTGLARFFRKIKPAELEGYNYIYCALVFFPGGVLLGIAARKWTAKNVAGFLLLAAGFLLPPLIFEDILVSVSGRPLSFRSAALSLLLAIAGSLWINADGGARRKNTGAQGAHSC